MRFLGIVDYQNHLGEGYDPLGILYVLAAIRNAGHEVKMAPDRLEDASRMIEEWKPDFVGFSVYTGNHRSLIDLNRQLKEIHRFISIFGGPHPTYFPEMIEQPGVDIICQGEAELAILELLEKVERGEDYSDVKNFWVKKDGQIVRNPVRPFQPDLDALAFPAREFFYAFPEALQNKTKIFITARGCPYACTYCYVPKIRELYRDCSGNYFRHRSVDNVIQEIKQVQQNYPLDRIHFSTDNFTMRKDWVLEFAERYRQEVNIPFTCLTRAETATPEVCKALKSANCLSLWLGLESGNEQVRKELLNRHMTDEQILAAAKAIKEAGLRLKTFNIIEFPGETLAQAFDTLRLNQQCRSDLASCNFFIPYPKTKLCDYAVEHGFFDGDFDSLPTKLAGKSPIKNPRKKQFWRLQRLFGIGVEWPWLTPLIKIGIYLPLAPVYSLATHVHWHFRYRFRIWGYKLTPKAFLRFLVDHLLSKVANKLGKSVNRFARVPSVPGHPAPLSDAIHPKYVVKDET